MNNASIKKAWHSPKIQRIDIKRTMTLGIGSNQDYLYVPTKF